MFTTDGTRIETLTDAQLRERITAARIAADGGDRSNAIRDYGALVAEQDHRFYERTAARAHLRPSNVSRPSSPPDFSEVRGALADVLPTVEAAAVNHLRNPDQGPTVLVLSGPPGCGKTMIARRVPTILPALADNDRTWITAEYEGVGLDIRITERPFRAPHHTISTAALVGESVAFSRAKGAVNPCGYCAKVEARGGTPDPFHQFHTLPRAVVPRTGEVGLARFGVLFLDELTEFRLESLRALGTAIRAMSPRTRPLLVAAMNACACGWFGTTARECVCSEASRGRYSERAGQALTALAPSGTVYHVNVPMASIADFCDAQPGPSSETIAARVAQGVAS